MKTPREWASAVQNCTVDYAHAHFTCVETAFAQAMADARRAAMEEAATFLEEHAKGHEDEADLDKLRGLARHAEDHRSAAAELWEKAGGIRRLVTT